MDRHDRPVVRGALSRRLATLIGLVIGMVSMTATAQAASVPMGTADSFAVLAGSAVTNTGPSVISGDVGVSPTPSVTGFPPGTVNNGTIHAADAVATQAQADLVIAYDDAAGRSSNATISADLAGSTLTPGVYTSASSLGLSGDLTLDAQGDPDAVFVFQAGSTLTAGSGSRVLLTGGAQACNVFWQVGSSATIGSGSAFTGNILALTSISMTTGATLEGSALARNGATTLDTNTITDSPCAATAPPVPPPAPAQIWAVDTWATTTSPTPVSVPLQGGDTGGATVTYTIISGPANGTLAPVNGDSVTYTPDQGYTGTDSFTYTASSANGTSLTQTGTIVVTLDKTNVDVNTTANTNTNTTKRKKNKNKKRNAKSKRARKRPAFTG